MAVLNWMRSELSESMDSVRSGSRRQGAAAIALVVAFAALLIAPFVVGNYWTRVLTGTFMFVILTQAWNVISGYTNYFAFGNVVFLGQEEDIGKQLRRPVPGIAAQHPALPRSPV